ncbi:UNVERIFIED_CONTAM: hypothetical protein H355_006200 [Colinus virginianus]|nr:hypothetical protein H355_006200 [Colinus virginianus]
MSLALHDLLMCCRRLENERATERRNEIENFKRLLRDPETVLQLDRNSDSRRGNQLNWDAVFSVLKKYFQKEMENLRLTKPNASASTQTSKQKRMQEIGSLVKYFIRHANRRGPRLECQELLKFVLHIIKDPASCAAYGSDCSSILLKDILSIRKYWCEISQQQWPGHIEQFIIQNKIDMQERNTAGLDHIIAAMNIFFNTYAVNCRKQICKIGEEILPTVLYIWTQNRPKDSLKVFTEDTKVLEITQPSGDTGPSKRRRIEFGWDVIRDNLQKSQKDFDVVPWLQITTQLLSKYPMSFPNCELPPLLNILHQLLPHQRRGERTPYVLKCLTEVALCQNQKTDLKSSHKLELQRTWSKICSLTIRSVSFQQIETESFGLLGAMIQGNLVVTDKELWKIFSGPACKPSSSAVSCLALVMSAYSVPENLDVGMEQNNCERNLDSMLKVAIMKWILSCYLEEEMEECAELPPVLCSVQHLLGKEENSFSDVEELYLQTTFDKMDIFTNFAVNIVDKNVTGSRLVINQSLRETLECCLLAMSEKLLINYAPKSKLVAPEHLVRCVSLLVGVLGCYCYTGVFTEEDACKSELFQKAKNSANKVVSNLFLRLLTSKFINDLLDICKNLMTFTGKPNELGEVDLVGNDPEESMMEADNQVSDDLFDDHSVADISDTNDSELQNVTGAASPLAEEQLTKQDLLHLEILRFLCICATTVQIQTVSFRASDVRRKLLMLTDGSVFDSAKPLHLHMYLLLLKELPAEENLLPVDEVLKLLTPLSLFQDMKQRDSSGLSKPLPLELQQKAFENVYLRAQEGMGNLVLKKVSDIFGYKSIEDFMTSHLDYLVVEWLKIKDSGYSLSTFPYVLLNYTCLEEFYRSCYKVLVPHLVIRSQFEDVKSLGSKIGKDWRQVLADCFPKILVNILPHFAYQSHGQREVAEQRETASKVYDVLKDENCLGKQQIDNLSHNNLSEIVVELLMTLHEPPNTKAEEGSHLSKYIRSVVFRDVSMRSFSLCCDLLQRVCHTAVTCCNDALESHLHVIVGTLIPLAVEQPMIQPQVLGLLKYLVIDNKDNEYLYQAIQRLDPFPEYPAFKELRTAQLKIKYKKPEDSVMVKLVVSLLQLSKMAVNHAGEKAVLEAVGSCLGEIGPMDFSTIALQHAENTLDSKAVDLLEDKKLQWVFIMLTHINTALTDNCIDVRAAAVSCLKNILATNSGSEFWEVYKNKGDPMLIYLQPFRVSKKKVLAVPANDSEASSETLNDTNLWIPLGESHETWIKNLTRSILDSGGVQNEVLQLMKPLCEVKTDLSQTLLPYLIHDILLHDSDESWRNSLSVHVRKFFTACCRFASSSRSATPPNSDSGTVFDDSFWLDLNYLEVAVAAQSCAAHFTALLYAEIYADKINIDKQQERIRTYEHEAVWDKALLTYDLEATLSPSTRQAGIIEALQNFGLCHTLSMYLKGLEHENTEWCAELQEIRYQAAWRNMQWDSISSVKNETGGPGYHESLYYALQSLRDKEFSTFYDTLKVARVNEVEELCKGSLESVYTLYPSLCRLQLIGELENIGLLFSRPATTQQLNDIYLKWQRQSQLLEDSDFRFQEPIMALRTVILEILLAKENENDKRECIKDILTKHLVELSKLARTANNTQLPERAMFQIKQHNPTQYGVSEWQLEEAQVFWAKKEESLALNILKELIKKLDANWFQVENDPHLKLMYTECLRLCGTWLAETRLENPTVIMQKYLEKAVEVAASHRGDNSDELKKGKTKAFLSLARFSDNQYQQIENYMKSSEFENKQALLKKAKEEVGLLRERRVQTNRYTVKVQRELELDECAIHALTEDRQRFLCKAVENYISCLLSGEEHDMWIFRLCSLWLENSGVDRVNEMMKKNAEKIPSYKFLPLMYQLAARMGTKMTGGLGFHEVLNNDRMEAARNIINIIRKRRAHMVRDVEALCDAYITLANVDATPWKAQRDRGFFCEDGFATDSTGLSFIIKRADEFPKPQKFWESESPSVDPTGRYENLVTVKSFKPEFHLAGGLNLPKIINCVGSDGKERRQLVKVVPLSQRSGVLEWCSGTTPIGEFLVNPDKGAHKRYRPHDYSDFQCQKIMMDAQKKHSEEKYNIFMKVCDNFQPVFRYFCMEKFRDPAVWFEKRLAYTRSVATSSIVGYILGLGDRHVHNILIDEQTAELVHIDQGVAFEQGKILPTPETVPFRLTRDIVDGMGITGVEGVFRRCCEKTMAVMRNSQEALLTIVEVLLYDPLFDWTMNPLKALYLQQRPEDEADMSSTLGADPRACKRKASSDDQSFNKVAERVLMRLQEKLKGVEEGTVLSVGGQVNLLIQQAMDPKNLSRLFPGWKAWV